MSKTPLGASTEREMVKAVRRWMGWRLLAGLLLVAGGCAFGGANEPVKVDVEQAENARAVKRERRNIRPPINTTRNLYEGSLWMGAASWGNLLRDHRARFRGDLLTVVEMQKIIKVPETKPEDPQAAAAAAQGQQQEEEPVLIDPILAFLKEQEVRRKLIDQEQNEILRSIDSVEVEVVRVLSNGNMVVRGVHPPIFRDRNRIKYIVTLNGLVRPSDVDEKNAITANKLSKAEYKIRRLVLRQRPPLGSVARAGGRRKEGALLDRLTDFATSPGGNRTTRVR